jgi:uncharacterized membrane protein YfcA
LNPVFNQVDVLGDLSTTMILLALVSLIGGIGITAIGPGGVLVTIALFLLTDLSPAEIAGTAIMTHIGTGIAGSLAYARSGQLREPSTRQLTVVLCIAAVIATPLGVMLNTRMPGEIFGILLAALVVLVGVSIFVREHRRPGHAPGGAAVLQGWGPQALLGGGVALTSGVFGLGGPMIAVPGLVLMGVPILQALGSAQTQSIVLASIGTILYLAHGSIIWPLVLLTGLPQIAGVVLGWKIARALPQRPLTFALALVLVVLGPVIALMR